MTKRPLIWAFLPLFFGVFWVALGGLPAGASVIYSQNFDTLYLGDLNAQDSWVKTFELDWQVQNTYFQSSPQALLSHADNGWSEVWRNLPSPIIDGYLDMWFWTTDSPNASPVYFRLANAAGTLNLNIEWYDSGEFIINYPWTYLCDQPSDPGWTRVQVEFQLSGTKQFRGRCVGLNEWTNWIAMAGAPDQVDKIGFVKDTYATNHQGADNLRVGSGSVPEDIFPVYSVDIIFPANDTTIADFNNWFFNYKFYNGSAATTSLDFCTRIFPGASTTTAWWYDCAVAWDIPGNSTTTRGFEMAKANPLWAGLTYSADARLYIHDGELLATSDLISFTISTSSVGIFEGMPVATTTELVITCDPSDPFFQYSLCKLATWLFVPSPTILNRFADLKTAIQNKAPIGYFTAAKDVLATLKNGTPTTEFVVLTGIIDPIKTGLAWLFWFVFLFWLFNRIRHLDI